MGRGGWGNLPSTILKWHNYIPSFAKGNRDIRVLGAQKSEYQKMGAAYDFFFESPFSQQQKNHGRGDHNAPIVFFLGVADFLIKNSGARFPMNFFVFLNGHNILWS